MSGFLYLTELEKDCLRLCQKYIQISHTIARYLTAFAFLYVNTSGLRASTSHK